MNKTNLRRRWLLTGGVGASLVGLGVSATIEVGFYKNGGGEAWVWIALGTLSLSTLMIGLILLIKAGLLEMQLK